MKRILLVTALLLVSCGQSGNADSADCRKVQSITSSGKPVAALGVDVMVPGVVPAVAGSVLPAGSGGEVPAGESTLAMPDPDVDKVVAAGKATGDVSGLRAEVERLIGARGWRVGSNSQSSDGRFSLEYSGPGVSGSVVVLSCGDPMYLVSQETSPPLPKEAVVPSCNLLRLQGVVTAGGVPGLCTVKDGNTTAQVTFDRPPVDPFQWRPRLQELRRKASEYVRLFCGPGVQPTATKELTAQCASADAFGARAAASAVRDNDFWVGVQVEMKDDGVTAEKAGAMATAIVRGLVS